MVPIGERIKRLRGWKGWSQKKLADAMGITQSSLSTIESSIFPPLERIYQICSILDYQPWKLFIEEPDALKEYMPEWMTKQDIEMLYIINTMLDPETRELYYRLQKEQVDYLIKLKKASKTVPDTINDITAPIKHS
jgi:transcriptional regulator with XRE-family HTH domain